VRLADLGGFERLRGETGRVGGFASELRVEEEARPALAVVDDRDLEEPVGRAEELFGQEREIGDVADYARGDPPARVADDRRVAQVQAEDVRRVDAVVESGHDDQSGGGCAERHRRVRMGEPLVAREQRGHPGHDELRSVSKVE